MREAKLKKRTFYSLLIGKIITIVFILLGWQSYVFTKMEMFGTLTIVLPLFTVYTTVMLKEFAQNKYVKEEEQTSEKLNPIFRKLPYWIVFYTIAIIVVLYTKAIHFFKYEEMKIALGSIESGFGIYLGTIIFELFKKEEKNNPQS